MLGEMKPSLTRHSRLKLAYGTVLTLKLTTWRLYLDSFLIWIQTCPAVRVAAPRPSTSVCITYLFPLSVVCSAQRVRTRGNHHDGDRESKYLFGHC